MSRFPAIVSADLKPSPDSMQSITFSDNEEKVMTIGVLTILAVTGSLVVLKPGVMVLVVI